MWINVTKELKFCAAHRIFGHEGKCSMIHGHNYIVEVTIAAAAVDNLGRLIDFGDLKRMFQGWLDEHWDHRMILYKCDPICYILADKLKNGGDELRKHMKKSLVDFPFNPTAENMAWYLMDEWKKLLYDNSFTPRCKIKSITVHETPGNKATAGE